MKYLVYYSNEIQANLLLNQFKSPLARSRFCAVAIDQNTIAILGGEVDEEEGFPTDMKTYSLDQLQWEDQPSMLVGRKVLNISKFHYL